METSISAAEATARVRESVWAAERHLRLLQKRQQQHHQRQHQQQQQQQQQQQHSHQLEGNEQQQQQGHWKPETLLLSPVFTSFLHQLLPLLPPAHTLFMCGPLLVEVVRCDIDSLRRSFLLLETAAGAAAAHPALNSAVAAAASSSAPLALHATTAVTAAASSAARRLNALILPLFSCLPMCCSNDIPLSSAAKAAAAATHFQISSSYCCGSSCCCGSITGRMSRDTFCSNQRPPALPLCTDSSRHCRQETRGRNSSSACGSSFCCCSSSTASPPDVSSSLFSKESHHFSFVDICCSLTAALDIAAYLVCPTSAASPAAAATSPPTWAGAAAAAGSWSSPVLQPTVSLSVAGELVRAAAALLAALLSAAAASLPAAALSAAAGPAEAGLQPSAAQESAACSSASSRNSSGSKERKSGRGKEGDSDRTDSSEESPTKAQADGTNTAGKEERSSSSSSKKENSSSTEQGSSKASRLKSISSSTTTAAHSSSGCTRTSVTDSRMEQQQHELAVLPSACAAAWVSVLRLCEACCRLFVAAVEAEVFLSCHSSRSSRRKGPRQQQLLVSVFCEPPAAGDATLKKGPQQQLRHSSSIRGEPQQQQGVGRSVGRSPAAAETAGVAAVAAPSEEAAMQQPLLWSLLYIAGCAHAARWLVQGWGEGQQHEGPLQQQKQPQPRIQGEGMQKQQQCEHLRPCRRSLAAAKKNKKEEGEEDEETRRTVEEVCLRLYAAAAAAVALLFAGDDPRQQTLHFEELLQQSPRRLVRQQLQCLQQQLEEEEAEEQQQCEGSAAGWWMQQQRVAGGGAAAAGISSAAGGVAQNVWAEQQQQQQRGGRRSKTQLWRERGKEQQQIQEQQQEKKSAAALVLDCLLQVLSPSQEAYEQQEGGDGAAAVEGGLLSWPCDCCCLYRSSYNRSLFFSAAAPRERLPQLGLLLLLPTLTVQLTCYLRLSKAVSTAAAAAAAAPTNDAAASAAAAAAASAAETSSGRPGKRLRETRETAAAAAAPDPTGFRDVLVLLQVLFQQQQQQHHRAFPLTITVQEKQQHSQQQKAAKQQQQQWSCGLRQVASGQQLCILLQHFLWEEAQSTSLVQQWQVVCCPAVALLQLREDPQHLQRDALLCFGAHVMLRLRRLFVAVFSLLRCIETAIYSIKQSAFSFPAAVAATDTVAVAADAAAATTARPNGQAAAPPSFKAGDEGDAEETATRQQRAATATASVKRGKAAAAAVSSANFSVAARSSPACCSAKCCCCCFTGPYYGLPAACVCGRQTGASATEQQRELRQLLRLVTLLRSTLARQGEELWGGLRLVVQHLPAAFEDMLLTYSFSLLQHEQHLWLLLQQQQQQLLALLCAQGSSSSSHAFLVTPSPSWTSPGDKISASSSSSLDPSLCYSFSPPSPSSSASSVSQSSCSSVVRDAAVLRLLYDAYMENCFRKQQQSLLLSLLPFVVLQQRQVFPGTLGGSSSSSSQRGSSFFAYLLVTYGELHDLSALLSRLSTWQQQQQLQPEPPAQQQGQRLEETPQGLRQQPGAKQRQQQKAAGPSGDVKKEKEKLAVPCADDKGLCEKNRRQGRGTVSCSNSDRSSCRGGLSLCMQTTVHSAAFLLSPVVLQHFGSLPVTALPAQLPALADSLLQLLLNAGDALAAALRRRQQAVQVQQQQETSWACRQGSSSSGSRRKVPHKDACTAAAASRRAPELLLLPTATRESTAADARGPHQLVTGEEAAAHEAHPAQSNNSSSKCMPACTGASCSSSGDACGEAEDEEGRTRSRTSARRGKSSLLDDPRVCVTKEEEANCPFCCRGQVFSAGDPFLQWEEAATTGEDPKKHSSLHGLTLLVDIRSEQRAPNASSVRLQEAADLFALIENVAVYRLSLSYFAAGFLELQHPMRRSQQLQQQLEALLPRLLSFWTAAAAGLLQQRQLFTSLGMDQLLRALPPEEEKSSPLLVSHPLGAAWVSEARAHPATACKNCMRLRGTATAAGGGRQHQRRRLLQLWQHSEACISVSLAALLLVFRAWDIPPCGSSSCCCSNADSSGSHSREGNVAAAGTGCHMQGGSSDPSSAAAAVALQQQLLQLLQQLALRLLPGSAVCNFSGSKSAATAACDAAGDIWGSKGSPVVGATSTHSSSSSSRHAAASRRDEQKESDSNRLDAPYIRDIEVSRRSSMLEAGTEEAGVLLGVRAGLLFLLLSNKSEWADQQQRQQQCSSDCLAAKSGRVSMAEQIAFAAIECLNSVAAGDVSSARLCGLPCGCDDCPATAVDSSYCTRRNLADSSSSCSTCVGANRNGAAVGEGGSSRSSCLCKKSSHLVERGCQQDAESWCGELGGLASTAEEGLLQQIGWQLWNAEVLPYIPLLVRYLLPAPSAGASGGAHDLSHGRDVNSAAAAAAGSEPQRHTGDHGAKEEEIESSSRGGDFSCSQKRWRWQRTMATLAAWVVPDGRRALSTAAGEQLQLQQQQQLLQRQQKQLLLQHAEVFEMRCLQPFVLLRVEALLRNARLRLTALQLQHRRAATLWPQRPKRRQQHSGSAQAPVVVQATAAAADADSRSIAAASKGLDASSERQDSRLVSTGSFPSSFSSAEAEAEADFATGRVDCAKGMNDKDTDRAEAAATAAVGAVFKQMRVLLRFVCVELSQGSLLTHQYCCSATDAVAAAAAAPAVTAAVLCHREAAPDAGERKRNKRKTLELSRPEGRLLLQQQSGEKEELFIPQRRLLEELWRCFQAVLAWLVKVQAVPPYTSAAAAQTTGKTVFVVHPDATNMRVAAAAADAAAAVVETMQALAVLSTRSSAAREAMLKALQERQPPKVLVVEQQGVSLQQELQQQEEQQQEEQPPPQACRRHYKESQPQQQLQPQQQGSLQEEAQTRKKKKRKRNETASPQQDAAADNTNNDDQRSSDVGGEGGTQWGVRVPLSATTAAEVLQQLQQLNASPFMTLSHILAGAQQLANVLWITAAAAANAAAAPSLEKEGAAPPTRPTVAAAAAGAESEAAATTGLPALPREAAGPMRRADALVQEPVVLRAHRLTKIHLSCHLHSRPTDAVTRLIVDFMCYPAYQFDGDEEHAAATPQTGGELRSHISATIVGSSAAEARDESGAADAATADTATADTAAADAAVVYGEGVEAAGAADVLPRGLWRFTKAVRAALIEALLTKGGEGREGNEAQASLAPRDCVRPQSDGGAAAPQASQRLAALHRQASATSASPASLPLCETRWHTVGGRGCCAAGFSQLGEGVSDGSGERDCSTSCSACGRLLRQLLCVFACLTGLTQHVAAWRAWQAWAQQQQGGHHQRRSGSSSASEPPDAAPAGKEGRCLPTVTARASGGTAAAASEPLQVLSNTVAAIAASLHVRLPLPALLQFLLHCLLTERAAKNVWRQLQGEPQQYKAEEKGARQQQQGQQQERQQQHQRQQQERRRQRQKQEGKQKKKEAGQHEEGGGRGELEQEEEKRYEKDDSTGCWWWRCGSFHRREQILVAAAVVARHALMLELLWQGGCKGQQMADSQQQSQEQHSRLQQQQGESLQHVPSSEKVWQLLVVEGEMHAEGSPSAHAAKKLADASLRGGKTARADSMADSVDTTEATYHLITSASSQLEFTEETVLNLLEALVVELWDQQMWGSQPTEGGSYTGKRWSSPTATPLCSTPGKGGGCGDEVTGAFSDTSADFPAAEEAAKGGSSLSSWRVADVALDAVQEVVRHCCRQWAAAVHRRRRQLLREHPVEGHPSRREELQQQGKELQEGEQEQAEELPHQLVQQQKQQDAKHRDPQQQQQERETFQRHAAVGRRLVAILVKIGEIKILHALNRGDHTKRARSSSRETREDPHETATASSRAPPHSHCSRFDSCAKTHLRKDSDCQRAICKATGSLEQLLLQLPSAADVCEDGGARPGVNASSISAASASGEWGELLAQQLPAGLLLELVSSLSCCLTVAPEERKSSTPVGRDNTSCVTSLAVGQALLLLLQQRTNVTGCLRGIAKVRAGPATVLQQQLLRALCSLLQRLQRDCRDFWSILAFETDRSVDHAAPEEAVGRAEQQLLCAWLSVCVAGASCVLGGIVKLLATEGQKKARREQGRLATESSSRLGMMQVVSVGRGALEAVALLLARGAQLAMETLHCISRERAAVGWLSSPRRQCTKMEHLPCEAATQLHALLLLLPLNPQLQQLYLPFITDLFVRLLYVVLRPGVLSSRRRYAALLRKAVEEVAAWRSSATTYSSVKRSCQQLLLLLAAEIVDVLRQLRLLSASTPASSYSDDGESVARHLVFPPSGSESLLSQPRRSTFLPAWAREDERSEKYHISRQKDEENAAAAAELVKALVPILKSTFEGAGIKDVDDEALAQVCANLKQPLVRAELIGAVKLFEKFDKFKGKV